MKKLIILVIFALINASLLPMHLAQATERDAVIMITGNNRQSIVMKANINQSLSDLRLELTQKNRMAKDDVFLSTQKIDVFRDDEAQWIIKDILHNDSISLMYRDSIRTAQFLENEYMKISLETNEEENRFWHTIWHWVQKGDIKIMTRHTPEALYPRIFPIIKNPSKEPWLEISRDNTSQNMNLWDYRLFTRSEGSIYNTLLSLRFEYNQLTGLELPYVRIMRPNYYTSDQLNTEYQEMKWEL